MPRGFSGRLLNFGKAVLSGILAERLGVRRVLGLCVAMLLVLIAAGYVWRRPQRAEAG